MSEIEFRPVSFAELSAITHKVSVAERTKEFPGFVMISFDGIYRDGHAGAGDARYIVAIAEAARKAWRAPCTIIDFRNLQYRWGDEMSWVARIGWDQWTQAYSALAIIVGDKCRDAPHSLLESGFQEICVDTLERAVAVCIEKNREYDARCKLWHESWKANH